MEVEHKAFWAIKALNFDYKAAAGARMLDLNELEEIRLDSYRRSSIYKEQTKRWHDGRVRAKKFAVGQQVLIFNSRLKMFLEKFRDKWSGPYTVKNIYPNGVLELLHQQTGDTFKINGHRPKPFST